MAVSADTRVADAETVLHLAARPRFHPPTPWGRWSARWPWTQGRGAPLWSARIPDCWAWSPNQIWTRTWLCCSAPEASTAEQTGPKVLAGSREAPMETAEHLMRAAVTVGTAERLDSAVHRMRAGAQETAAVVDEEGRLLGYPSLFEVLSAFLEAGGAGLVVRLPAPRPLPLRARGRSCVQREASAPEGSPAP